MVFSPKYYPAKISEYLIQYLFGLPKKLFLKNNIGKLYIKVLSMAHDGSCIIFIFQCPFR